MTEIRPIRTEADYEAALAEVGELWGAKSGTPEGDRLDVLATLIEVYEDTHHKIPAPDPIAAIEFRMEQQGLTRKDLEPFIGSRARVSEVMSRKRSLSIDMIRRLHVLGIPLESLVAPFEAKVRKLGPGHFVVSVQEVAAMKRRMKRKAKVQETGRTSKPKVGSTRKALTRG